MPRTGRMFLADDTVEAFRDGFARLRADLGVPGAHPAEVLAAAERAAARRFHVAAPGAPAGPDQHVDRTDVGFVTLDPASSTDLDQAFAIERSGDDVLLHYAIADVGAFVQPGDAIDAEAWRRGVTVYLPDGRAGLHPPRLAEDAASLLPGSPKPAVVFVVRVAADGGVRLDGVERSLIRSRAKLAYSTVTADDLPPAFDELARRIEAAENARGADRIQWPEQEVVHDERGRFALRFRPRNVAERRNAAMSLATNMAVADALFAAGTGLFRTMPAVDERRLGRLRHTARAFGLDWPAAVPLRDFERSLPADDPRTDAFRLAVRRASGGATYTSYRQFTAAATDATSTDATSTDATSTDATGGADGASAHGARPWHAAVAATYAHVTAPLRRLADRYVIEAALAVAAGRPVPDDVEAAFDELPAAMQRGDSLANRADREAIDLAEAILLQGREGDVFGAVVTDEDDRGVRIQLREPAVVARVVARSVDPGDEVLVKLVATSPADRSVEFERVG